MTRPPSWRELLSRSGEQGGSDREAADRADEDRIERLLPPAPRLSGDAAELAEALAAGVDRLTSRGVPCPGGYAEAGELEARIERLCAAGAADAAVRLLPRLLRRVWRVQDDRWDDGPAFRRAVEAFGPAVRGCSLPGAGTLGLLAACLQRYRPGIRSFARPLEKLWDDDWPADAWAGVAGSLLAGLEAAEQPGPRAAFEAWDRRMYGVRRAATALDRAGEPERATELLVAEAVLAWMDVEAVRRLLERGDLDRAEALAVDAIAAAPPRAPGIVEPLQMLLGAIGFRRGDARPAAAVAAERFFEKPGPDTHAALLEDAARAGLAEPVAAAALRFLETDRRPTGGWPLPALPGAGRDGWVARPHFQTLIRLAIAAGDAAAVRRWHDARLAAPGARGRANRFACIDIDQEVAAFFAPTDPVFAAGIHFRLADDGARANGTGQYEAAAAHVHAARRLLAAPEHRAELDRLETAFRADHGDKRWLMPLIDAPPPGNPPDPDPRWT